MVRLLVFLFLFSFSAICWADEALLLLENLDETLVSAKQQKKEIIKHSKENEIVVAGGFWYSKKFVSFQDKKTILSKKLLKKWKYIERYYIRAKNTYIYDCSGDWEKIIFRLSEADLNKLFPKNKKKFKKW